ncbi:MAG: hypothetical protein HY540_06135 [Deltaproteobacteria bacterium]|nr:hypothetical protein [Deltaproteobacteria bacterium]
MTNILQASFFTPHFAALAVGMLGSGYSYPISIFSVSLGAGPFLPYTADASKYSEAPKQARQSPLRRLLEASEKLSAREAALVTQIADPDFDTNCFDRFDVIRHKIFRDVTETEALMLFQAVHHGKNIEALSAVSYLARSTSKPFIKAMAAKANVDFCRDEIAPEKLLAVGMRLRECQGILVPQLFSDLFFLAQLGNASAQRLFDEYPIYRLPGAAIGLDMLYLFAEAGRFDALTLLDAPDLAPHQKARAEYLLGIVSKRTQNRVEALAESPFPQHLIASALMALGHEPLVSDRAPRAQPIIIKINSSTPS